MDPPEVPYGMDPASTFKLKISFTSQSGARTVEESHAVLEFIDSERTNFTDFMSDLHKKYPWSLTETLHLNYYDSASKSYVSVKTDQDMLLMFEKFMSSKYIELIGVFVETNVSASAAPESSEATNQATRTDIIAMDTYLVNPFPLFEHVGVNDEVLYGEQVLEDDEDEGEEPELEEAAEQDNQDTSNESENDEDDQDWISKEIGPSDIPKVAYDKNDPPMHVGATYSSIEEFRVALCHHALKYEFEYNTEKTDPERLRAYCKEKEKGCQWRIHASALEDRKTIQVKVNPCGHTCGSRQRSKKMKHATKAWICDKVMDWVRENATVGAIELQRKLRETYFVEINYKRVYAGYQLALEKVYGNWRGSFDMLYSWKAEVEKRSPGSVVIIEHHVVREKHHFRRMFVAFKACVDGFLNGCRPYLSIDSTFLTGRFRGQLATTCAVDGHNWLFPVVFAIMECEDGDNWEWFMEKLHDCIGDPEGLAICTDAGKGLCAVKTVFRKAEHRECMRHLVTNFKKRFHGRVFDENLWPAAYAWQPGQFEEHMSNMVAANPEVQTYLAENHPNLWSRSKFNELSKVDYVTNNLAESFNSWIRKFKAMHVCDLAEKLRLKLMEKFDQRRRIGRKMGGLILPHIYSKLKEKSHNLRYRIQRSGDDVAEVYGKQWTFTKELVDFKHVVDLNGMTCTCREWQISGKPCLHAIAFITYLREENLQLYVHSCYTIKKFRAAYEGMVPAMTNKKQWPKINKGFFLYPPLLRRSAGRPKVHRYKGSHEPGGSKKKRRGSAHECPICHSHGHHWNTCKDGNPEDKEALALLAAQRKAERKRKAQEKARIEGGSKTKRPRIAPVAHLTEVAQTCLPLVPCGASSGQPASASEAGPKMKKKKDKKQKGTAPTTPKGTSADSPAMGTRSKKKGRESPAMGTRSKKRLSDFL